MLAGYDHLLAAARRLQWDADAIDLAPDRAGVRALAPPDRATLSELATGFWVAEHAVAAELEPFVVAAGAGSAARACFAAQARDEARHAHFFDRVAREVLGMAPAAARAAAPAAIRELFEVGLPKAARTLAADATRLPAAVGLYHLVLEGIVFAAGQDALLELLDRHDRLPGVRAGTARVQADERWHVGLGVLHLQRVGAAIDVAGPAAEAIAAWGPRIATPERMRRVLGAHERRLRIAGADGAEHAQAIESAA